MAVKKGCQVGHKSCDCKMHCCAIPEALGARIAAQARSDTNWAEALGYGAACICGHLSQAPCPRHPEEK